MSPDEILDNLYAIGAVVLDGHFVYSSDKHGPGYVNFDPAFPRLWWLRRLLAPVAQNYAWKVDVVAAPATGGIVLAIVLAQLMNELTGSEIAVVWADKVGKDDKGKDIFAFERASFAAHLNGHRTLFVEDVLTTGGSLKKTIAAGRACGARVVGAVGMVNRGGVHAVDLGVDELICLLEVDFVTYEPDACPLCADQAPIVTNIGHGEEYSRKYPNYLGGYREM